MARTEKFSVKQVRTALEATGGIKSLAAAQLRCAPNTLKGYLDRHPSLASALEEIKDANLDIAEAELLKQIHAGNMTAIIFYLKTKGRERGYAERRELTGPDGGPLEMRGEVVLYLPDDGRNPHLSKVMFETNGSSGKKKRTRKKAKG